MTDLSSFIVVRDNHLPSEICTQLIEFFDKNTQCQNRIDHKQKPAFTQIVFTEHKDLAPELHDLLTMYIIDGVQQYRGAVEQTAMWLPGFDFEQVRIKRYLPNDYDMFDTHVDAINADTAKRFLAMFWYLNDVDVGGETEFTNTDIVIKPQTGKLVIFPPMWMFPHKGNRPVSNSKFLLSTYLHFR